MFRVLVCCLCGLLMSCTATKVHIDKLSNFDKSANASFAWVWAPMRSTGSRTSQHVVLDKVIRAQVNNKLTNKGYTLVEKNLADFLVSYTYLVQSLGTLSEAKAATTDPTEAWVRSGRGNKSVHSYQSLGIYETGSLMIILENQSGKVIWQGAVTKLIEYQDADEKRVNTVTDKALSKLFAQFPNRQ